MEIKLEEALKEVQEKTESQIEQETAYKWASRACASFTLSVNTADMAEKVYWLVRGLDFEHESREHMALSYPTSEEIEALNSILKQYKEKAIDSLNNNFAEK